MAISFGRGDARGREDRGRAAVLDVTLSLLEQVGYQGLQVDAVAARAGVDRATIHRWWTTRALLVAEVLQRFPGPAEVVPSGDVRADVRAVVLRTAAMLGNPVVADGLAGLAADAARDPVASERLAALLAPRRAADTSVLLSAAARGDLPPDTDVALLLDVVFGTLLFRRALGAEPSAELLDGLVELVVSGRLPSLPQHRRPSDADGAVADGRGALYSTYVE